MKFFRYRVHMDDMGWTVFDIWTGLPVVIDNVIHVGMDEESAYELGWSLEVLRLYGDRRIFVATPELETPDK